MHGSRQMVADWTATVLARASEISHVELLVLPPFVYLSEIAELLAHSPVCWGAQTVSDKVSGAFTGEISVSMLRDLGCRYTLVGHSERRCLFGETNAIVASKFSQAIQGSVTPILCVGETLAEREQGKTAVVIQEQLAEVLRLKDNLPALSSLIVAYEPVWAIGTGQAASPEQAQGVHQMIREVVGQVAADLVANTRILYGGSVKPGNAAALFEMPDVDGALVGGAALDPNAFIEIGKQWNN